MANTSNESQKYVDGLVLNSGVDSVGYCGDGADAYGTSGHFGDLESYIYRCPRGGLKEKKNSPIPHARGACSAPVVGFGASVQ